MWVVYNIVYICSDPYEEGDKAIKTPILVDVDLALSACANATR